MTIRQLALKGPVALAINLGDTTPNPGISGTEAWSTTLGAPVVWNGTSWTSVFGNSPTIVSPTLTGPTTMTGVQINPAAAMTGVAIDVTKTLNTKSIAADTTFTFSGTPVVADTWFGMFVKNTDTVVHTLTLPSAFDIVAQATKTTCSIRASGELYITWRWDGSAYHVFGASGNLDNFAAAGTPAATDDVTKGYGPGSLWGGASVALYWCRSNAAGAAVWVAAAGTAMGDMLLGTAQTVTAAKTFNDATLVLAGATSGTSVVKAPAAAGAATVYTLPPTAGILGYQGIPQNSKSAAYTMVLADAGCHIYHPAADTTARIWTVPANSSVPYPIGTTLTFDNDVGAGAITIAITTDTLVLVGAAGSTGSRTLAAGGRATAIKVTATRWRISGSAELT